MTTKLICTKCLRACPLGKCEHHDEGAHLVIMDERTVKDLRELVSRAWRWGIEMMSPGDGSDADECDLDERCGEEGCQSTEEFVSRHNPFEEDWAE